MIFFLNLFHPFELCRSSCQAQLDSCYGFFFFWRGELFVVFFKYFIKRGASIGSTCITINLKRIVKKILHPYQYQWILQVQKSNSESWYWAITYTYKPLHIKCSAVKAACHLHRRKITNSTMSSFHLKLQIQSRCSRSFIYFLLALSCLTFHLHL